MSKPTQEEIYVEALSFIGRFSTDGNTWRQEVLECFLRGCCYWFAYILSQRFAAYNPALMIDYVVGHFGCRIGEQVFDITGEVTDKYDWNPWSDCTDTALKKRIEEGCIMF